MKPEPKKNRTRVAPWRHVRRQHRIDVTFAPHAAQEWPQPAQQSPVVDLTVKFRTDPPVEVVVPMMREDLETAAKVAFWIVGGMAVIEFINEVSRRR